jgi:Sensors of blue-light using FAD
MRVSAGSGASTLADDTLLTSLTYTSAATRLLSVAELVELIEQIRVKNERLGVTGLLLYSGGNVIQTLEGTSYAVDAVFDAIQADPRHGEIHVVERRSVEERAFATWSMGFRNVSAREVDDLQDFGTFARDSVGHDLTPHAASAFELLEKFRVSSR